MFFQASVILFTREKRVCIPACTGADTDRSDTPHQPPPGQTPPDRQPPLQLTVRILLECILVLYYIILLLLLVTHVDTLLVDSEFLLKSFWNFLIMWCAKDEI